MLRQSQQLDFSSDGAMGPSAEPLNRWQKLGGLLLIATVLVLFALALLPADRNSTWSGIADAEIAGP